MTNEVRPCSSVLQRALNQTLRASVDRGGRFVQNQNARVREAAARSQSIAAALVKAHCRVRQARIVSLRQTVNERIGVCGVLPPRHLFVRRLGIAVTNIFLDGRAEQKRVLQYLLRYFLAIAAVTRNDPQS